MISLVVPPEVVTVVASPTSNGHGLSAEEEACIAKALPARRREFAAGRSCAHAALAALGIQEFSLLPGVGRQPVWPTGIVGSITHCRSFCAAAVARAERIRALGIDAEREHALTAELVPLICTARERSLLARYEAYSLSCATIIFSAKESVYKAYFPTCQFALEFHGLEVDLDPESETFEATIVDPAAPAMFGSRTLRGRFARSDGYVCTGVALSS